MTDKRMLKEILRDDLCGLVWPCNENLKENYQGSYAKIEK
jgi:hypothetical protein